MAEKHLTLRDFEDRVNKTNIVNGSSGKQGDYHSSEPGFYCKTCDMSLKDSLSYVDHLIDAKHLRQLGLTSRMRKATLDDVKERLEFLRRKKNAQKNFNFDQRLAELKDMEEKEELMRLEKRREERKLKKEKKEAEIQQEKEELERGIDPNVMEMMGISGFGGTKKK